MKIKRYFANDMRRAIRMVRDEQGPDAVILSNRRVNGGVEILAAVDYNELVVQSMVDEQVSRKVPARSDSRPPSQSLPHPRSQTTTRPPSQPAQFSAASPPVEKFRAVQPQANPIADPGVVAMRNEIRDLRGMLENRLRDITAHDKKRPQTQRARVHERLRQLGLSARLSTRIAECVEYRGDILHSWRQALAKLSSMIHVTDDDIISRGGIVALIGPTGVGKTSTVAKLAARFTVRHGAGRVVMITTDRSRIGARQQLYSYGRALGAPVHVASNGEQLREMVIAHRDKALVLIDTAGMSPRELQLPDEVSMLYQTGLPVRSYVVLSASSQRRSLEEVMHAINRVELDGVILTKLDETTGLGEALSVVVQHRLPVAYISDGKRIPENLHPARSNNLVNRSLTLLQHFGEPSREPQLMESATSLAG
ncbi:MAG: flagellar biosynthesis protein FlhF [Chromatiales bacterium]|nr:flagellar biosynthesis protein FlhF [Chromatiales bacterium]